MPQINEYRPEVNAQGAVGGVTPNLEAVSLFGRGVEHVGAALEQAGDVIHRRQAQQEISQVYGQFAQARADWNIKLKAGLKDGSLDPDKFDQDYADYVNKAGDGIQTAEGKDFFNRQANRLGGTLMQNAMIGKAKIAGERAFADISQGINVHVANLMSHPEQVDDALGSTEELISAKQKDGTLTPEQAIRIKSQLMPQLAEAAVKGLAEQDPGQNEKGEDNENLAKQSLDQGHFAELLNEPQRAALYQYARAADNRRQIDGERAAATAHRLLEKQGQDYLDQNGNRILNGQLSAKEIQTAPLTFQQKEYALSKIKAVNNEEAVTDKRVFHNVYSNILNGNITTREQLITEYNKGKIAPHDMPFLEHQIDNTPDGLVVKNLQKQLDNAAKSLILKGPGGVPVVAAKANFDMEVMQARQAAEAQGIPAKQFFSNTNLKDPTSPFAILAKHQIGFADRMGMVSQQLQAEATGQGANPNINRYSNSPTKEVPPPTVSAPQANPSPPAAEPAAPQGGPAAQQKGGEGAFALEQLGLAGPEVDAKAKARDQERQAMRDSINTGKRSRKVTLPADDNEESASAAAQPKDDMIRPGESITAWKKRTGK